jgi:sugar/nucleoside kinase (ribokinase family)
MLTRRRMQVGGNTNFAIAAARLGLRVSCLGHTGRDVYGAVLERVLSEEGVGLQQLLGTSERQGAVARVRRSAARRAP